jgi:hypothetical chaperone protein
MSIYAIDYGTSNSLLVHARGRQVSAPLALDPGASDPTVLRSLMYFRDVKESHFGQAALREFVAQDLEGRLVRSVKKFLPSRAFTGTVIGGKSVSLETMIGRFLGEMRARANAIIGEEVTSVVLGRPALFSANLEEDALAETRMRRAAESAGFRAIEFLPEPVAAALDFKRTLTEPKTVLVADYGGGTSDYSILRLSREPFRMSDVLATHGISIAGDALDGAIMRREISPYFGAHVQYRAPFGSNVLRMPTALMELLCSPADLAMLRERDTLEFFRNVRQWSLQGEDEAAMQRLFTLIEDNLGFSVFEEIERVKRVLSSATEVEFCYSYPSVEITHAFTRLRFEEDIAPLSEKILRALDETLARAQLKPSEIDLVCCTGGTARVPLVRRGLVERFGADKLQERDVFHSVVQGLGEYAASIA